MFIRYITDNNNCKMITNIKFNLKNLEFITLVT